MHAPHEMDLEAKKDEFWALALKLICKAQLSHRTVWLFIDANARTGSIEASCFGPICPENENDNGGRLRRLLTETNMVALNTFVDAGTTWVSNYETEHRLDYV